MQITRVRVCVFRDNHVCDIETWPHDSTIAHDIQQYIMQIKCVLENTAAEQRPTICRLKSFIVIYVSNDYYYLISQIM